MHLALLHSNCGSVTRYNPFRLIGVTEGESHRLPDVGSQPWKTARQAEPTLTYPSRYTLTRLRCKLFLELQAISISSAQHSNIRPRRIDPTTTEAPQQMKHR